MQSGGEQATISFVKHGLKHEDYFGRQIRQRLRQQNIGGLKVALNATATGAAATKIKRFLHAGRFPVMWKERWIGPANLERANMRITGMETYAIVAAVLLQVILGIYGSISEPQADDPRIKYPLLQRIVFEAQMVLLMVAVLCSTYTMVMFLLIKIYTVTALGMHHDVAYEVFTLSTARFRSHAFWALITSIITFLMAFALNLYTKVKGNRGIALSAVTLAFVGLLLREGASVLLAADDHIFGN